MPVCVCAAAAHFGRPIFMTAKRHGSLLFVHYVELPQQRVCHIFTGYGLYLTRHAPFVRLNALKHESLHLSVRNI